MWFGGGRLGSDLSLPQLRQFWEATPAETAAAAEVWRSPGRWGREINAVATSEWRRVSRVLDKAYEALGELPADSSQWPVVARELSGLYAAWSRRLEGSRPGPLARAADILAQAGQVAPTDTPAAALGGPRVPGGGDSREPGVPRAGRPWDRLGHAAGGAHPPPPPRGTDRRGPWPISALRSAGGRRH